MLKELLNCLPQELEKSQVEIDDEYDLEDEAKRLKKEMEITMREVQESKFYAELCKQIRESQEFNHYLRSAMESHSHVQIVVYASGSIEYNYHSQFQMAIIMSLQRDFSNWIRGIEVFDPVLSPADKIVLQELGCTVLSINERCKRQVERPTLFFMAYPCIEHVGNLLAANWCPSKINQVILLTNRMSETLAKHDKYIQILENNIKKFDKTYISYRKERIQYFKAIKKHTREVKIRKNFGIDYDNIFFDFAWHFFNVKPNIDMETLLPVETSKTSRMEWSKTFDKQEQHDYLHAKKFMEKFFMTGFKDSDKVLTNVYGEHRGPCRFRCKLVPHPQGWIKLNVSGKGGNDKISSAGFGAMFYNDKREPIAMINGNLEGGDEIAANVEALKQALKCLQSWMSPIKKLIVEGDNLSVIRWVNHSPEPPERIREALVEIHALMKSMRCVVYHIYEEANLPAIELANKGAMLQNVAMWISEKERKQMPYSLWDIKKYSLF